MRQVRHLKLVRQNSGGARLNKGSPITADDGWRGKVLQDDGETVVCLAVGERENDYLRGYRAFSRRWLTFDGKTATATVNWNAAVAADKAKKRSLSDVFGLPDLNGNRGNDRGVALDLDRARIEREWQNAPE
jgi:hypothetical protein